MAAIICMSVTACGSKPAESQKESTAAESTNQESSTSEAAAEPAPEVPAEEPTGFDYSGDFIAKHLTGDYSITYKMTYYETGTEVQSYDVTLSKSGDGYYTKMGEGMEMLFIKNGEKYDMYMGDEEGVFTLIPEVQYTEEEVVTQSAALFGYMSVYEGLGDALNKVGTEKIAGRDCEKYSYEASTQGYSAKMDYYIDKENGICMKYFIEASAEGEKGGFDYECVEFKTSGVTLPEY